MNISIQYLWHDAGRTTLSFRSNPGRPTFIYSHIIIRLRSNIANISPIVSSSVFYGSEENIAVDTE
jgi:hypothetical protein